MIVRLFALLLCLPLGGCATIALTLWAHDEVVVDGTAFDHGDPFHERVLVAVKNVEGVEDGSYEFIVPGFDGREVVEADDGVLEARPLQVLTPAPNAETLFGGHFLLAYWEVMDRSDARAHVTEPSSRMAPVEAFVEQDGDTFRVHVLRLDAERGRWVRTGIAEIGDGTQWPVRKAALVLLPATIAFDLITWPLAVILVHATGDAYTAEDYEPALEWSADYERRKAAEQAEAGPQAP